MVGVIQQALYISLKNFIKTKKNILKETKAFDKLPDSASLIHPYFGGTSRAPCAMELYLKRLR